jgi:hypothetical protein
MIDNKKILKALISDLYCDNDNSSRLIKTCIDANVFYSIFYAEKTDVELVARKEIQILIDKYFISTIYARQAVNWILQSLDYNIIFDDEKNDIVINQVGKQADIFRINVQNEHTQIEYKYNYTTDKIHSFDGMMSKPTAQGFLQAAIDENGKLYIDGEYPYEKLMEMRQTVKALQVQTGDDFVITINQKGSTSVYSLSKKTNTKQIRLMSNLTNIVQVQASAAGALFLDIDGNVKFIHMSNNSGVQNTKWHNIKRISMGAMVMAGVSFDGKVYYSQWYNCAKYSVERFTNIVDVACGNAHIVGVKKDGTCVATGSNVCGQCNVHSWHDVIAVFCGGEMTIGIKRDGTVYIAGEYYYSDYENITYNLNDDYIAISQLSDMVNFQIWDKNVIGLDKYGKLHTFGLNYRDICNWSTLFSNEKNVCINRNIKLFKNINNTQISLKNFTVKKIDEIQQNINELNNEYKQLSIFNKKKKQEIEEKTQKLENDLAKRKNLLNYYDRTIKNSTPSIAMKKYYDLEIELED